MSEITPIKSFLSPHIKNLFDLQSNNALDNGEEDLELKMNHWNEVIFSGIFDGPKNLSEDAQWPEDSIKMLKPLINDFRHYHLNIKLENFFNLTWTGHEFEFKNFFYALYDKEDKGQIYLNLLKTSSLAERILGDVFLINGKLVPFLLRDLLDTVELKNIFGNSLINYMKILMGSVHGLNLRNIGWHGFLSTEDIHPEYTLTIIYALHLCGIQLSKGNFNFKLRPQLLLDEVFILLESHLIDVTLDAKQATDIIDASVLVFPVMRPYWHKAINLILKRDKEAVILLMPLLENSLRILFASVNKCSSERILTATNSAYYITMDEILAPKLKIPDKDTKKDSEDKSPCNLVPHFIGKQLTESLYDLFHLNSGPRIRDRISHGEVHCRDIPFRIIEHIFNICLLILSIHKWRFSVENQFDLLNNLLCDSCDNCKLLSNNNDEYISKLRFKKDYFTQGSEDMLSQLMKKLIPYQSVYHPFSLLKTSLLKIFERILVWKEWPKPDDSELEYLPWEKYKMERDCEIYLNLRSISQYKVKNIDELIEFVHSQVLCILDSFKIELELCRLLQKLVDAIEKVIVNMKNSLGERCEHFNSKSLRSRQRKNFVTQLDSIPLILNYIIISLNVVIFFYRDIKKVTLFNDSEFSSILKFLKRILKIFENVRSYTELSVNKYQEALNILENNNENILKYFEIEKFQLLINQ